MGARAGFGSPRGVLTVVASLVAVLVVLAGCATAGGHRSDPAKHAALTSTRPVATARHTFDPYSKSGKLTVDVSRRATGSCWSTSLGDPTRSAFRCFAGNQILDPCFASAGASKGGTVACVADPWSKATVLTLTKALPSKAYPAHRVWAFVRSDGTRCVAATGTVPAVAGRNLDYTCSDHTSAALIGARARHVRTAFAKAGATSLRSGTVRDLWHS